MHLSRLFLASIICLIKVDEREAGSITRSAKHGAKKALKDVMVVLPISVPVQGSQDVQQQGPRVKKRVGNTGLPDKRQRMKDRQAIETLKDLESMETALDQTIRQGEEDKNFDQDEQIGRLTDILTNFTRKQKNKKTGKRPEQIKKFMSNAMRAIYDQDEENESLTEEEAYQTDEDWEEDGGKEKGFEKNDTSSENKAKKLKKNAKGSTKEEKQSKEKEKGSQNEEKATKKEENEAGEEESREEEKMPKKKEKGPGKKEKRSLVKETPNEEEGTHNQDEDTTGTVNRMTKSRRSSHATKQTAVRHSKTRVIRSRSHRPKIDINVLAEDENEEDYDTNDYNEDNDDDTDEDEDQEILQATENGNQQPAGTMNSKTQNARFSRIQHDSVPGKPCNRVVLTSGSGKDNKRKKHGHRIKIIKVGPKRPLQPQFMPQVPPPPPAALPPPPAPPPPAALPPPRAPPPPAAPPHPAAPQAGGPPSPQLNLVGGVENV